MTMIRCEMTGRRKRRRERSVVHRGFCLKTGLERSKVVEGGNVGTGRWMKQAIIVLKWLWSLYEFMGQALRPGQNDLDGWHMGDGMHCL